MLRNLNRTESGKRILGTPYLGVLGADIPSSGDDGASVMWNNIALPADAARRFRAIFSAIPSAGAFAADENGATSLVGAPDGAYTATYDVWVDDGSTWTLRTAADVATYLVGVSGDATAPGHAGTIAVTAGGGGASGDAGAPGHGGVVGVTGAGGGASGTAGGSGTAPGHDGTVAVTSNGGGASGDAAAPGHGGTIDVTGAGGGATGTSGGDAVAPGHDGATDVSGSGGGASGDAAAPGHGSAIGVTGAGGGASSVPPGDGVAPGNNGTIVVTGSGGSAQVGPSGAWYVGSVARKAVYTTGIRHV